MGRIFGYARISTSKQSIERQIRNIEAAYPGAIIRAEIYTGTKFDGRKEFERILKDVKQGDTIVFDSVSRMSRNAEEGIALYEELYQKGVSLVFLKEHYIDTATYDKALSEGVPMTGTNVDIILKAVNEYLKVLRKEQIVAAFAQAQKEVDDLHTRTKEAIRVRQDKGLPVGGAAQKSGGRTSKKEKPAKEIIRKHSKVFGGSLNITEIAKQTGLARTTVYRYIEELQASEEKG